MGKQQGTRKIRGFSLIELSALLVVIGLALTTMIAIAPSKQQRTIQNEAIDRRAEIVDAINRYLDRNGRYPCVASNTAAPTATEFGREVLSDCVTDTSTPGSTLRVETAPASGNYVRIGAVPTRDLLLPDRYAEDGYGNRYTYIVMEGLTKASTYSATTAAITVVDGAGASVSTNAAYAVLSHGKDGKGAYRFESGNLKVACGATTNLDVENCDGDALLRLADYNDTTTTAALFYDDLTHYEPKGTPGASPSPSPSSPAGCGVGTPSFTGFRAHYTPSGQMGGATAAGDINGDGCDDLIIGGAYANSYAGYTYVIFSSPTGISTPIDMTSVNGTNGFRLDGSASSYSGNSLSTADINNDGYDDIILGAMNANGGAGYTYVIFGKSGAWSATNSLATLADGTTGFRLDGTIANDFSGGQLATGDINNDGFQDIVIGAHYADNNGTYSGSAYVVFGKAGGWSATTALSGLNGTTGFRLDGAMANQYFGSGVASGDVNNDGFDDILVRAPLGNYSVNDFTYVVFGKAGSWSASAIVSTLTDGTTGFAIDLGVRNSGGYVNSGDINGDGYADITMGHTMSGNQYVVFGKASGWSSNNAIASLANGTNGFALTGASVSQFATSFPAEFGDINDDGFEDIILGSAANTSAGSTFVVFGKASGWAATSDVATLNGSNGFRLNGTGNYKATSTNFATGDFDGDGISDFVVGASPSAAFGNFTYGIYGKTSGWSATYDLDTLTVP
jgi:type II secretory pathway pseudopilin PulG